MSVAKSMIFRAAASTIVLLCGCMKMPVPSDLAAASDELPITGRSVFGGGFQMGPYEVGDVDRRAGLSGGISLPGFSSEHAMARYSYVFKGGSDEREGACIAESDEKAVLGLGRSVNRIGCVCKGSQGEATVELRIADGGQLYAGGHVFTVEDWPFFEATGGYRVDRDGPAGGVTVLHPGRVWLARSLESSEREDLACLFGGLLLYEPPK